jgi:hypothetical protein
MTTASPSNSRGGGIYRKKEHVPARRAVGPAFQTVDLFLQCPETAAWVERANPAPAQAAPRIKRRRLRLLRPADYTLAADFRIARFGFTVAIAAKAA